MIISSMFNFEINENLVIQNSIFEDNIISFQATSLSSSKDKVSLF